VFGNFSKKEPREKEKVKAPRQKNNGEMDGKKAFWLEKS
jgi:hypothetical protein